MNNRHAMDACRRKFEKLLDLLDSADVSLRNDVYLEMVLSHLKERDHENLIRIPKVIHWIKHFVQHLNPHNEVKMDNQIIAFGFRLAAILIETDEYQFESFLNEGVFDEIQTLLKANIMINTPSVKLGNVALFTAILKYPSGVEWIKRTNSWNIVLDYCKLNKTIYVQRAGLEFLFEFICKTTMKTEDDEFAFTILSDIFKPITENVYKDPVIYVDCSHLQEIFSPCLDVINYIIKRCVETTTKSRILYNLLIRLRGDNYMWKLTSMTHDHEFLKEILTTQVHISFAILVIEGTPVPTNEVSLDINEFAVRFFNVLRFCIIRKSALTVLSLAKLNLVLWKLLGASAPIELKLDNQRCNFELQTSITLVMPILFVIHKDNGERQIEECLDAYIMKLFAVTSEHTMRLCYSFRDLLNEFENKSTIRDLAYKSLQTMLSMKNMFSKEAAVIIFQAMMHALKEFTPDICRQNFTNPVFGEPSTSTASGVSNDALKADLILNNANLLSALLSGIHIIVQDFNIKWTESVESIGVLFYMIMLLKNPNLTPKLTVQALQLAQLSIEHYLSPNLALLVDSLKGSSLEYLGSVLVKRLGDIHWEVRDSAIELLTAVVKMAHTKYPAFQSHLVQYEMRSIVMTMIKNDTEHYVVSSGLVCLSEMVKIEALWENNTVNETLFDHLLKLLYNESEGSIRRDAVLVMVSIYEHQKIPKQREEELFATMSYTATKDLYWEVKLNSLKFWQLLIEKEYEKQGVIDGNFPSVTFSTANKKIINLTPTEITIRLHKILNYLNEKGCLGVLWECLHDSSDTVVVKDTIEVIEKLLRFLNKYNYFVEIKNLQNNGLKPAKPTTPVKSNFTTIRLQSIQNDQMEDDSRQNASSDAVIDMILSSDDINLLATEYKNTLKMSNASAAVPSTEKIRKIDINFYKQFIFGSLMVFLDNVTVSNWKSHYKKRVDWIQETESFESLITDILCSNGCLENTIDCY